ncbi:NAD transhydrogenase mitochondrial precursor [Athelia psychrophila]|uniref:NAD(P) transhydrogenase, mitochondrial n=1 Tax=Athelia psychrophila TaxID=1759441 RepID=A0A167V267_9AGAM|nr:NAD transhydrogenase mitochondrial precursor [Fibularhizoctonia sp. CBS 109695]
MVRRSLGLLSSIRVSITLCPKAPSSWRLYHQTKRLHNESPASPPKGAHPGIPYSSLTVGVPREIYPGERRVSLTPINAALLKKKGVARVLVERGAGTEAQFLDEQYTAAGATLVGRDVMLKVRPPLLEEEAAHIRPGSTVISFLYPAQNKPLVEMLASRKVESFAMDMIPRISRAQVFDALSSMANIAGYKAVLEASNVFGRFLTGQTTAAGKIPPCKVLVIGAGVAGLSAIATARRMGAIVRGFDSRPAAREQVQSLGAEFLEVTIQEDGTGAGGYAKEMSKEFHDAEMALFMAQAKDVDIIITTALIPGKPAPKLITNEMVAAMKQGSVIVDLAAEAGGNVEACRPGLAHVHRGVTVIGYTDLPSRLPTQSSTLYSNNITKFLLSMGGDAGRLSIDLEDEVVRGALVVHGGAILTPVPRVMPAAVVPPAQLGKGAEKLESVAITPWQKTSREIVAVTGAMGTMVALGKATGTAFMDNFFTFGLAGLVGYRVVWGVAPALHSPLMSVTNALSGMVGIGGLFVLGGGYFPGTIPQALGAMSVLLASVNVAGGFVITKRMLDMFKRKTDPPEYSYLYAVPAVVFSGGFLAAASTGMAGLVQAGYLTSSMLCIASLSGLGSQATARQGNALGMLGVGSGVIASLGAVGFPAEVLVQFAGLAGMGGLIGTFLGRRITATDLPQMVAALHSVVGLAAVLTSIASVLADVSHVSTLHLTTAYLGVLIGGITFTGSIVAFLKLAGHMSSRPLLLPKRHLVNSSLLGANMLSMAGFLTMAPATVSTAATFLCINAALSFIKGYTTTAAVGGADMPVVITTLNAYSGFALVAEGFMLDNSLLTTIGSLIGVSGSVLSYIMCISMNRSLTNVLFGADAPPPSAETHKIEGSITKTNVEEATDILANADSVILVVGYGMAVAKASHAVAEISSILRARGINVRFAIHPVAGRMPGQCNVLLAEASVPYDIVLEMEEINDDFKDTDVTMVIGANDTVNPIALEKHSAIAGMPVMHAWESKHVIVMKRGMASGYADVPNPMFYMPNTKMLFGDAKDSCEAIKRALEAKE